MKKPTLPTTDSIQKLADFWDKHDVTDFDDELKDVGAPVFVRDAHPDAINVPLKPREAKTIERMAEAEGVSREELVRTWVLQKIARARP